MNAARPLDVNVCGAGMGGLAAAALLAADGHRVTVLDQAPAPAPVGSGLVIQPVGMAVLNLIGVGELLRALGAPISRLYGEAEGRVVLDARYDGAAAGRFGLAIQRRTLFEALLEAAKRAGAAIRFGARVTSADPLRGRVVLEGGETLEGDVAVDALGARSTLCPDPGRVLAYGALWGLLEWPEGAGFDKTRLEQRYRAASRMAGVLPLGGAEADPTFRLAYFWSLRADRFDDWRAAPLEDWKAEAATLWPETRPILDQIDAHGDLVEAVYRHRTLARPVDGRLIHLGDSWHATSPQLGQGANMALLDAASLALSLREAPHVEEGLRQYALRRGAHVAIYQAASRFFTPVYQSDGRVLPILRDRLMGPLSQVWPVNRLISALVAGTIGDPLGRIGVE